MNFHVAILLSTILYILTPTSLQAQQFVPAEKGCKVEFKMVKHKETIRESLNNLKGKIIFDPQHLNTASFDITISGKGNNPEIGSYFTSSKYPAIKIRSTGVTQDKPGDIIYILHGNITINGITKPANIQFLVSHSATGYTFRGSIELKRLDFNIGTKDDGIEENVSAFIEIRANKQ